MADALKEVKRHFGRDAVILATRTSTKGGLWGLGGRPVVEITAANAVADLPEALRVGKPRAKATSADQVTTGANRSTTSMLPGSSAERTNELFTELGTLKAMVSELVSDSKRRGARHVPEQLFDTYQKLVESEVAEKIADQLIERVRGDLPSKELGNPVAVRRSLARALADMLPTSGPIRVAPMGEPTVIALVGPTGVGKTTTVAKLAANFALRERKRVGLITVDTYRIAAVEQLKTYAQIIGVPLEIVASPDQLRAAVGRMADRDVVLLDTAGRSQRDVIKIKELKSFFAAVRPHEVHLVLSGTSSEKVLTEAIERFGEIGVDRMIFTKLDEAIGFGVLLTCLDKAKAKLSYVTTGQDVPDDIEVGEGEKLASWILGEKSPKDTFEQ